MSTKAGPECHDPHSSGLPSTTSQMGQEQAMPAQTQVFTVNAGVQPASNLTAQVAAASSEVLFLELGKHGLQVPLATGTAYFNYYWLREFCPSCNDPETRERIFDVSALNAPPFPAAAQVSDQKLVISWRDEALQTTLPLQALEPFAGARVQQTDPAELPRRHWYSSHHQAMVRLSQSAIDTSDTARMALARAVIEDGVALVTGMEDSDEGLTRLAQSLGVITPTVDGLYFDVRLTIKPTNLAFTARALEMHTDLPNEEAPPGVQFLHCRANSVEGGLSLFVDGAAVAEALRSERPDDFALLSSHEIPFFRRHENWDYRSRQRVIELDHAGEMSGLTISRHLQDSIDLPQAVLDQYYPALCRFTLMLTEPRFVSRFRLAAGECIVFDNHRVVHGREAFVATSGNRHLRGCYVDRAALRSTYRMLLRQCVEELPVAGMTNLAGRI